MKLTPRLLDILRRLVNGEPVPFSSLPKPLVGPLLDERLLDVVYHGTRRLLRAPYPEALKGALPAYNEAFADFDSAELLLQESSRAAQAALSGNSKTIGERSCPGFLVNTYQRLDCHLNGTPFAVAPQTGSAVYIADWRNFTIPPDALVVGVENMENFLHIEKQRNLIDSFLRDGERGVLFAARYAFSNDLTQWLGSIPNRYLHFGDFDLAGIAIFVDQFKPCVGGRGSFLIPPDIERRLSCGSRMRYDDQYARYAGLTTTDTGLNRLISLIHHYRRCYDQEGYIDIPS